jgi:vitamin B12 transport system permease protein
VDRVNALLLQQQRHQWRWLMLLLWLLLLVFAANLLVGPVSLSQLLAGEGLSAMQQQVLWQLRLPRACLALLLGAGLAMSGCVLQTLLQNPLAEPGLIGVSSGASLAAVLALFLVQRLGFQLPPWGLSIAAFCGALLVTSTLLFLARGGRLDNVRLLLLGVAIGICSSAITTWLLYFANDQSLREMMFWMMGSLAYGQAQPLWWWLPYLAVMVWLVLRRDTLTLLQLGDYQAQLMGLDLRRLRWQLVFAVCVLSGLAVALAGSIGFIGLLIPHLMRLLGRGSARFVLLASLLAGATTLLLADLLSRNLLPSGELPVGIITASLGAPLLIFLLVRRHV